MEILRQRLAAAETRVAQQRLIILRLTRVTSLLAKDVEAMAQQLGLAEPAVGGRCGVIPRGDDPPGSRPTRGRGRLTEAAPDSLHTLGGGGEHLFEREGEEATEDPPVTSEDGRVALLEARLVEQQATIALQQPQID